MSVDYTFYTIFGVKFKMDKFQEEVIVDSCDHSERVGQKFCPKCGLRVTSRPELYAKENYDGFVTEIGKLGRRWQFIHESDYSNGYVYLGFGIVAGDGDAEAEQSIDLAEINIENIKQELKSILTAQGVWTDDVGKTFRLYSVMDVR